MTLIQEAEMKLKMYEGFNDDDPSVIYCNAFPSHDKAVMSL